MELIVLKMPPERVAMLANALDRYLQLDVLQPDHDQLTQILVWLRYRHGKYLAAQSVAERRNQDTTPPAGH